jgi:hypothetical protein
VVDFVRQQNQSVTQYKGLGKFKLTRNRQIRIDERMAWAMVFPDKLRIEIRSISGISLASMAYNGKRLYFSIPSENRFIEKKARNSKLTKLIAIPVRPHDLMQTMAGRIPVRQHHELLIVKDEEGHPFTLHLRNRWGNVIEKIHLDASLKNVTGFDMITPTGDLEYQVIYEKMQRVGQYRMPSRIIIANRTGDTLRIDVDRHWLNIPVSPSLFRLTPLIKSKKASLTELDTNG